MSSYRRRPVRRPDRRPSRLQREEGDPIAGVIFTQVVLCCLLVGLMYFGRLSQHPLSLAASARMDALMEEPIAQVFAPNGEGNLLFSYDYAGQFFTQFKEQKTDLPQGGLFFVLAKPDKDGRLKAPENAILSPVRVTHPLYAPVEGLITSWFGYREHPTTGMLDFHTGLDIAAPMGTPIAAALPGVVEEVGKSPIYGNYITLRHSDTLTTRYCHCSEIVVEEGVQLREGETVALVGNTGVVTGPHLHFEVYVGEKLVDPAWVLEGLGAI